MKLEAVEVAVAGAGIGGLALATMLAREGCKVAVYDQMDAPEQDALERRPPSKPS